MGVIDDLGYCNRRSESLRRYTAGDPNEDSDHDLLLIPLATCRSETTDAVDASSPDVECALLGF
jgi:hypothetical protein